MPATVLFNPLGDGNCQFAAVSHQLEFRKIAPIRTAEELRKVSVAYLKENEQDIRGFIGNVDATTYLYQMTSKGTFGDHLTLSAMANYLKLQIIVVSTEGLSHAILVSYEEDFLPGEPYIIIGHNPIAQHYVSLDIDNSSNAHTIEQIIRDGRTAGLIRRDDNASVDSDIAILEESSATRMFECDFCAKQFQRKEYLVRHITTHTQRQRNSRTMFTCNECQKQFTRKYDLNRHAKLHQRKPERRREIPKSKHQCGECHREFTKKSDLVRHGSSHSNQKSFVCNICDRQFTYRSNLEKHVQLLSFTESEKPFCCDICQKKYKQQSSLANHKKHSHSKKQKIVTRNSNPNEFFCYACRIGFDDQSLFNVHMAEHTAPYKR